MVRENLDWMGATGPVVALGGWVLFQETLVDIQPLRSQVAAASAAGDRRYVGVVVWSEWIGG